MTAALAGWRPRGGWPRTWLAVLAGVLVLSALTMAPLAVLSHLGFNSLNALVIGLPCGLVGILVARRQPANPLGWLLLAIALCLMVSTDGSEYALLRYRLGYQHLPLGVAAIALNQLWGAGLQLLGLVVLLFPDGRLPSAWWRGALWAYAGVYVFSIVILAVATAQAVIGRPFQVDVNGGLKITDDASGWYGAVANPLQPIILLFMLVAAFSSRLKDAVDLAAVRADLARVTQQALEPAHVAVWLRDGAP